MRWRTRLELLAETHEIARTLIFLCEALYKTHRHTAGRVSFSVGAAA